MKDILQRMKHLKHLRLKLIQPLAPTVTVTPAWGYDGATVTDTTVDMLNPTASFDVTGSAIFNNWELCH